MWKGLDPEVFEFVRGALQDCIDRLRPIVMANDSAQLDWFLNQLKVLRRKLENMD